jgi:ankyrin repeat protein
MDLDKAAQIFLVRNGYLQPDLSLETWEAKPPLLHQAAVSGSGKVLLSILEYVDINQRDREERTPLMSAAVAGKANIIDLLLATGAGHTLADYDRHTALYHAILHSQKGMAAPLTDFRRNNLRSIRALLSHSQLIESIDVGMEAVYDILAQSAAVLSRPSEVGRCSAMLRLRYPWPKQLDDISSEYTDQQPASHDV